jgi:hypothetical protein
LLFYIYSEIFLIDYSIVDVYPEKKSSYPENFRILIEEDIGIEPNTLTGTSRLAGGPYRHQGLSSVVGTVGIEPTWNLLTFQPRIRRRVYVPWWRQLRFYRTRATIKTINTLVVRNPSVTYY